MSESRVSKILTPTESPRPSIKDTCMKLLKTYFAVRWGKDLSYSKKHVEINTSTSKPDYTGTPVNPPSDTTLGENMPYALRSDFAILYFQSLYMSKTNLDSQERAFNEFANNVITSTSIERNIFPKLLCQRFFDSSNPRLPTTIAGENIDRRHISLDQEVQLATTNRIARLSK